MITRVEETQFEPSAQGYDSETSATGMQDSSPLPQSALIQTPVLIVGAGPSGLLQAYLLSRLGVSCTIIERYSQRLAAPKAHALSPRSLEVCRQFGLDTHEIRQLGTPRSEAYWVNFITNLSGEHIGRLPYERMDVGVFEHTPEMIHNIPQPTFEDFIHHRLPDNVKIIRNASFVSCQQDASHVTTTVQDRNNGKTFEVKSQHLIACDGARSPVRSFLGIGCDGEESYETMMTIHFNADLRPILGQTRVGMLHWVMDPLVSGFVIGYDLSHNQVLICNFDSSKHPVESWNESLCREVLDCAIGQKVTYDVLSFRPWVLSRKVAREYRSGRVFLAGDAAHSFPPTGGLGLNSGLGDVHNLAYKIAAVQQGWAKDQLLDSYGIERQQIADINSQQSVKNGKKIFSLLKMMGATDPDVDQARRNLVKSLRSTEQRSFIARGIEEQQEHFDNLELHIGYVYGSKDVPPHASKYEPKFVPGARLPHVWVEPSEELRRSLPAPVDLSYISEMSAPDRSMRRYSSLDLCACDAFTILTGSDNSILVNDLEEVGLGQVPINVVTLHKDFVVPDIMGGKAWLEATGLKRGSTLVVRPDQHILTISAPNPSPKRLACLIAEHLSLSVPLNKKD